MHYLEEPFKQALFLTEFMLTFFKEALILMKEAIKIMRGNFLVMLQIVFFIAVFMMMYFGYNLMNQKLNILQQSITPDERGAVIINAGRDNRIHKLLEETRIDTHADRARFYQFHNGQKSVGDISFVYASVTNEVVGPGISSEIQSMQRMPASLFSAGVPDWLARKVRCRDVNELESQVTRDILKNQAITFTCSYAVFDESDNNIIGMVSVNFVRRDPKPEDIPHIEDDLHILSVRVRDALWANN